MIGKERGKERGKGGGIERGKEIGKESGKGGGIKIDNEIGKEIGKEERGKGHIGICGGHLFVFLFRPSMLFAF